METTESSTSERTTPPLRRSALLVLLLALLLVVAVAVPVTWLVVGQERGEAEASYPDEWDPRVEPFVAIAEEERGLEFEHPVHVRFLPTAEFEDSVRTDESDLTEDDREELDETAGVLRALGLLASDVDLFEAVDDATGGGTLGYYSFEDQRITMRGEDLTPASQVTLVHELVHVLQDQNFDVGERFEALGERAEEAQEAEEGTSTAESVLRAVVEGDATRVEQRYLESLPDDERRTVEDSSAQESETALEQLEGVPSVVLTLLTFPYSVGAGMVTVVAADGDEAVDDLLRDPPEHEVVLLDPVRILEDETEAVEVEEPALGDGEERIDGGEFGALTWYVMLAERIPAREALVAVDGWGGDSYVSFERDGVPCVRATYEGTTEADTRRMASALQQWRTAAPGSTTEGGEDGGVVGFESCDPGDAGTVDADSERSLRAAELLAVRSSIVGGVMSGGSPATVARCLGQSLIDEYTLDQLTDETFGGDDPAVQQRIAALAQECASAG